MRVRISRSRTVMERVAAGAGDLEGEVGVAASGSQLLRRQTRDVAHYAAAQCQNSRTPIEILADARIEHPTCALQILVRLAIREYAFGDAAFPQAGPQFREVKASHGGASDDHQCATGICASKSARLLNKPEPIVIG